MKNLGIHNGEDLYRRELTELFRRFGKTGIYFYNVVRGIDNREVVSESDPKSISCERTFHTDLASIEEILEELRALVERLVTRMASHKIQAQNLVIKIKYDNFQCITRSCTFPETNSDEDVFFQYAQKLLAENWDENRKVRLLGVGVDKLVFDSNPDNEQLEILF
jgi:DNA polymerase-4